MRSRGGLLSCTMLVVLAAACGAEGGADHNPGALYPDRANQYREDQERRIGEPAMLGGFTTTVTEAHLDDEAESIQVELEITNRDQDPQRIDSTQWTLVDPTGHWMETTTATFPVTALAGDATVTAAVSFAVDSAETGDYYIQYKPEVLDAARGIWQVTVS